MNDLTTQPPTLSIAYSATAALTVELAKMLALVAPISMTAEQQELWLRAAADSLEGIRPTEVRDISAELRRLVVRPAQIVPEIARLVAEKRKRGPTSPLSGTGSMAERLAASGNEQLRKMNRDDVHWIVRDGNAVIEWR